MGKGNLCCLLHKSHTLSRTQQLGFQNDGQAPLGLEGRYQTSFTHSLLVTHYALSLTLGPSQGWQTVRMVE